VISFYLPSTTFLLATWILVIVGENMITVV
jgi:hypothetical protein